LRKGGLGSQRQNVDALAVWPSFGFFSVASGLAVMGASPVLARPAEPVVPPSPTQIVEAAPPGDWVGIPADHLLVVDLAPDAAGQARRVIIQLMNGPWSQGWIGNIRKRPPRTGGTGLRSTACRMAMSSSGAIPGG
jgi:hypothetical protein